MRRSNARSIRSTGRLVILAWLMLVFLVGCRADEIAPGYRAPVVAALVLLLALATIADPPHLDWDDER